MINLLDLSYSEVEALVVEEAPVVEETPAVEEAPVVEETSDDEAKKAEWREKGLCQYCGGKFGGFFTKKCKDCGRKKDY